jgi:hypothetical protein
VFQQAFEDLELLALASLANLDGDDGTPSIAPRSQYTDSTEGSTCTYGRGCSVNSLQGGILTSDPASLLAVHAIGGAIAKPMCRS